MTAARKVAFSRLGLVVGASLVTLVTFAGCKKPASSNADGGTSAPANVVPAAPTPSASSPTGERIRKHIGDGGAPDLERGDSGVPPLPIAEGDFGLAAVGKAWGAKIIWLKMLGSRVWLSGRNVDAYSDDGGPLVKGPDGLEGLPYKAGQHRLFVTGSYPHLYALRALDVNGRMNSPELTAFVHGASGWKPAKKLARADFAHAFVPWGDGALVIHSQVQLNADPSWIGPDPGTFIEKIAPDGSVTPITLGLDKMFLGWDASSDGTTLTILGTQGLPPKKDDIPHPLGIFVARGTATEPMKITQVIPKVRVSMESYAAKVLELGSGAVVVSPPSSTATENGWGSDIHLLYFVGEGGKLTARKVSGGEFCFMRSVAVVDDVPWISRECIGDRPAPDLVRIDGNGGSTIVKLPNIAKDPDTASFRVARPGDKSVFSCAPRTLQAAGAHDLWVVADCGGAWESSIPAVFRRGHTQDPILLP